MRIKNKEIRRKRRRGRRGRREEDIF